LLHMDHRISIAGLISAALLALLAFPLFAFASFDVDLRYGDTGSEVTKMQQFLTAQGHFTAEVTGNFYAITLAAVQALQAKHFISPVSGYWVRSHERKRMRSSPPAA
jgi:peptidoglycan hydrolase-like protein with peptidoglycan-binding domain